MELLTGKNYRFVDRWNIAIGFSLLLIVIGLTSLVVHRGPRLSIDFTGGTILQVRVDPAPTTAQVRKVVDGLGFNGALIQQFGAPDEYLLTFPKMEKEGLDVAEAMKNALRKAMPDAKVEMRREESVGPKIGKELKTAAINSIVVALVLIVLYITVRFVFRYGIAAILALVHDVTITLGMFSLLNKEISLSIIAAFLTIIGYSLNDTIVVFDRIRENMALRRKESYREVVNRSINETLSRTIITSLTTVFVAASLYVLGGAVIHNFAFALTFGVIVGTYSSIFIASPILVWWHERHVVTTRRTRKAM